MKKITCLLIAFFAISLEAQANEDKERVYLTQILNQLATVKSHVSAASKEQPKLNRARFHYTSFRDSSGKMHNGLLEDIQAIENGIQQRLGSISYSPRVLSPIKGDYIVHNKE